MTVCACPPSGPETSIQPPSLQLPGNKAGVLKTKMLSRFPVGKRPSFLCSLLHCFTAQKSTRVSRSIERHLTSIAHRSIDTNTQQQQQQYNVQLQPRQTTNVAKKRSKKKNTPAHKHKKKTPATCRYPITSSSRLCRLAKSRAALPAADLVQDERLGVRPRVVREEPQRGAVVVAGAAAAAVLRGEEPQGPRRRHAGPVRRPPSVAAAHQVVADQELRLDEWMDGRMTAKQGKR